MVTDLRKVEFSCNQEEHSAQEIRPEVIFFTSEAFIWRVDLLQAVEFVSRRVRGERRGAEAGTGWFRIQFYRFCTTAIIHRVHKQNALFPKHAL
jgi:hypothetical protein